MVTKKVPEVNLHAPANTLNDEDFEDVFDTPLGDWYRFSTYSMEYSVPAVWANTREKKLISDIAAYWFKE